MNLTRRVFVRGSAVVASLFAVVRRGPGVERPGRARSAKPPVAPQGLAAPDLLPLAQCVLPSELGAGGMLRATNEFAAWIAGYPAHAELLHPYGSDRIGTTPPSPVAAWRAQLADLDRAAREAHGKAFPVCTTAERAAIVATAVEAVQRGARVPEVAAAPHVALALVAHFLDSPAATNLAYKRMIDPRQCRPLGDSPKAPVALRRATPGGMGATGGGR